MTLLRSSGITWFTPAEGHRLSPAHRRGTGRKIHGNGAFKVFSLTQLHQPHGYLTLELMDPEPSSVISPIPPFGPFSHLRNCQFMSKTPKFPGKSSSQHSLNFHLFLHPLIKIFLLYECLSTCCSPRLINTATGADTWLVCWVLHPRIYWT